MIIKMERTKTIKYEDNQNIEKTENKLLIRETKRKERVISCSLNMVWWCVTLLALRLVYILIVAERS